jgi:hypothetical protein
MRSKSVIGHQLIGDLARQLWLKPTRNVNACEFHSLAFIINLKFAFFPRQLSTFSIGLRVNRNVFARSH